jgi:hypothetical protein
VKYDGLIGMVQEADKILVFLPNAHYDPKTVKERELPPGMYQELGHGRQPTEDELMNLPPHFARLRFTNATVNNCERCETVNGKLELPLQGNDISFNIPRGLGTITPSNLNELVAGPKLISASRGVSEEELLKLDQLDPLLLPPNPVDKQRLAARVAIEAGTVDAILDPCSPKTVTKYSFKLSGESPGCQGTGHTLAEELVVTQKNVTNLMLIVDSLSISVVPTGPEVVIEVLNETKDRLVKPCFNELHPQAFRWFYRLLDQDGQKQTEKHYFFCRIEGNAGPPECPHWLYNLSAKVK